MSAPLDTQPYGNGLLDCEAQPFGGQPKRPCRALSSRRSTALGGLSASLVIGAATSRARVRQCGARTWRRSATSVFRVLSKKLRPKPGDRRRGVQRLRRLDGHHGAGRRRGDTAIGVQQADVWPPYSCRQGFCGTCRTRVLDGRVDHRDTLLTEPERADGMMLVCISRAAKGQRLTLDL